MIDIGKYLLMIMLAIIIGVAMSMLVLFGVMLCYMTNPIIGIGVTTLIMVGCVYLINKEEK